MICRFCNKKEAFTQVAGYLVCDACKIKEEPRMPQPTKDIKED